MSAEAKSMHSLVDCARVARSMEPYVDGELDAVHVVDVETHILACPSCTERVALARAVRSSLKRQCASSRHRASDMLRARICSSLVKERELERQTATQRAHHTGTDGAQGAAHMGEPKLIKLRYAVGLAAAAGIVFAVGIGRVQRSTTSPAASTATGAATEASVASAAGFDTLLEDLVALHAHPLPPETTDVEQLPRFEPLIGVPVRRPELKPFGGNFNGARVHAMRDRRAASLQYTVRGGHRVTVYVFDPRSVSVKATSLRPRFVRSGGEALHPRSELPVYVGRLRGYSIAAAEERGVGYALASDLGDDESADLMLATVR